MRESPLRVFEAESCLLVVVAPRLLDKLRRRSADLPRGLSLSGAFSLFFLCFFFLSSSWSESPELKIEIL